MNIFLSDTEEPLDPRTGRVFRGAVFMRSPVGDYMRVHCDAWSWQAEMYSLAGEDVFEIETRSLPWVTR